MPRRFKLEGSKKIPAVFMKTAPINLKETVYNRPVNQDVFETTL
jgi:hypothetical protein